MPFSSHQNYQGILNVLMEDRGEIVTDMNYLTKTYRSTYEINMFSKKIIGDANMYNQVNRHGDEVEIIKDNIDMKKSKVFADALEIKEKYNDFLRKLNSQLKASNPNYILTVAVAPKYRDNQPGILYEAHDYKSIGEIADRVIIMTYEWGYMYGEPMAVSPRNEMSAVIKYAITRIPANKILMGLPNYAYDWKLPFITGNAAEAISNTVAIRRAIDTGSMIMFDEKSQTPYYRYKDNENKEHVVWFDDAKSYLSKLELVNTYNLAGISIWTINNYYPPLLSALDSRYIIKKMI